MENKYLFKNIRLFSALSIVNLPKIEFNFKNATCVRSGTIIQNKIEILC